MSIIKFHIFETHITDEELKQDQFDVDFDGSMMVRFERQKDGSLKPINAMDGWGDNCYSEIKDIVPIVCHKPTIESYNDNSVRGLDEYKA